MNDPVLALGPSAPMARVTNFAKVAQFTEKNRERSEKERNSRLGRKIRYFPPKVA